MKGRLKYLFLFFLNCGNEHYRGHSDYHFLDLNNNSENKNPKLTIKLKKNSSSDEVYVTTIEEINEEKNKLTSASNSKGCSLEVELVDNDDIKQVSFEKKLKITCSDGEEYFLNIEFNRKFQLINFDIGPGKVYHLVNVSTNLPNADLKTDCKNKTMYNTYQGENVVEIEY